MQVIESLQTLVDETYCARLERSPQDILDHAREAGPRINDCLREVDTLAGVGEYRDLLVEAALLIQATNLADLAGDEALRNPAALGHAENLTALGLAAGDPDLVFLGKANHLLSAMMQTVDHEAAESLREPVEQLSVHPLLFEHDDVRFSLSHALAHLGTLQPKNLDPRLAAVDEEVARWIADEPESFSEEQTDRFVELIGQYGVDLNLDTVELLFTTAMGVLDAGDGSIGIFIDRLRLSHAYYVALRFVNRPLAFQALMAAAAPLYDSDTDGWVRENLRPRLAAAMGLGAAGGYAALNSSQWRVPLDLAKKTYQSGNEHEFIDLLIHEGDFLVSDKDHRKGFAALNQAYSLAREEKFLPAVVRACVGLASLYFFQNMHRNAADLFISFLADNPRESVGKKEDQLAVAQAEVELALMYRFAGDQRRYTDLLGQATGTMDALGLPVLAQQSRER